MNGTGKLCVRFETPVRLWMDVNRAAERLIVVTAVLPLLHHVDRISHVDHSGWQVKSEGTPFTFTLLVYPLPAIASAAV